MSWSAKQYVTFEQERSRPARDLLAALPPTDARQVIDLGCGPGNSTELLAARFPGAAISALDSSADMLAAARVRLPAVSFTLADIGQWCRQKQGGDGHARYDVMLANAVLQWLPSHATLLPALLARLAPGGSLALQMPDNLDEPAHGLMRAVAADGPWASRLAPAAEARSTRHDAQWYYGVLHPACAKVTVWRTTYYHPMAGGASDIVEWFKGAGLRPYLDLLDQAEQARFLDRYRQAVSLTYPALPDGSVLLPFPRLFVIATS